MLMNLRQNEQLKILQNRFKEIIRFLKKPSLSHTKTDTNLYKSPWYLVTGPKNAGKTTLLANSDLRFILQKAIKDPHNIANTTYYEWWATKEAVLVDTPGINIQQTNESSKDSQIAFFKLLKKYCYKKTLNAILIVISIENIAQDKEQNKQLFFESICNNIEQSIKIFGKKIPFYFIINKCDLIPGFREFFGEQSKDERWQPWGIKLSKQHQKPAKILNLEFNKLLRRINDQLIWRLQHEHHLDKRFLVNEFPLEMEQVKQQVLNFTDYIYNHFEQTLAIRGLFFTSATQKFIPAEKNKEKTSPPTEPFMTHAYFSHDLFEQIFFQERFLNERHYYGYLNSWGKFAFLGVLGAVIIAYFTLYLFDFKQQTINITSVQQVIASYQLLAQTKELKQSSIEYKLKLLDTLQLALKDLNDKHSLINTIIHPSNPTEQLRKSLLAIYTQALQHLLLPEITHELYDLLKNPKQTPARQYGALKTYLMMQDATRYNPTDIALFMQSIWRTRYATHAQAQLLKHLQALLKKNPPLAQIDPQLVNTARNTLKQARPIDLAYTILQNNVSNNQLLSIDLNASKSAASILTFSTQNSGILSMYTEDKFPSIYPDLIQKSAEEALAGNWIVGITDGSSASTQATNALKQKLAEQYLANYITAWSDFLNTIKTVNFTDIDQLNEALKILGQPNSPISQLITLIKKNFPPTILNVSDQFQTLVALTNNDSSALASLQNITQMLGNLSDYLSQITSDKKAFELTSDRMHNPDQSDPIEILLAAAANYPEPIKTWLNNISMNAWQLMMYQAQTYISQQWQKQILPPYQAQLVDHFPFNPSADKQTSLDDFDAFFAPDGLFDKFFTTYLKPFIDTSKIPWTLRNTDGETLQLSGQTLAQLERVYIIQYNYFQRRNDKLLIPMTLQLVNMENNLDNITIALGKQRTTYKNSSTYPPMQLNWPDEMDASIAQVIFTNTDGQQAILQEDGAWAWLKLLNNGNFQKIPNAPQQYQVTFDKDGNAANAIITLDQRTNPFSMNLFKDFRLPDTLE
ncbi:MAG: type VI secretion system membrane subunit TssM [Pseudomonadota bacterium]